MKHIPTVEEFLEQNNLPDTLSGGTLDFALTEFAKLHVQAALEAAANDADLLLSNHRSTHIQSSLTVYNEEGPDDICTVNKNSILNAYPSSLIK